MNFHGFNKLTLLDFPGRVACTLFTGGCDLRCPFCHNSPLVLSPGPGTVPEDEIIAYLQKRKGVLDGVAVTGGEPLLQPGLPGFLRRVRELGMLIKLDTNGCHPDALASLLSEGLIDYIAMDIKNSPDLYPATVGIENFDISPVLRSIETIMKSGRDYEFRTTAVREFHSAESFRGIGRMIEGAGKYYIQNFVDSGALITGGLHGFEAEELEAFAETVRPFVGEAGIRGI